MDLIFCGLSPHVNLCVTFTVYDYTYINGNIDLPSDDEDDFYANLTFFSLGIIDGPTFPSRFVEENVKISQNLTSPDISSHSLFLENYLFVQIPSSKFDHLPNSASTPKTHKTIVKYNMEKLGTCRKFSGYPRENGAKFQREFESFSTLHELDEDDEAPKLAAFYLHLLTGPCPNMVQYLKS
jgi:hypothetical protein